MRDYEIETEERVTMRYIVRASSEEDARTAFEAGYVIDETPGDTIDVDVKWVRARGGEEA